MEQLMTEEKVTNKDKKKIAVIILAVVFFMSLLFVTVFVLKKHDNTRRSITAETFEQLATENGYAVGTDKEFLENEKGTKEILIAVDDEDDYQIEWILFDSNDRAKDFFETVKKNVIGKKKIGSNTNFGNYNNFNMTTDTEYVYITRVDNTFFYAKVDKGHKAEVKAFIDKMGY